ncbi:gamma-glutamylcyclotransferase family protein [Colwelliaceae bacterium 6471]
MKYFAYGSNMSLARLQQRVPSAKRIAVVFLEQHQLRFHKLSLDGSGKCDAYLTGETNDLVIGTLYEIDGKEKWALDEAEGLGHGYDIKNVQVRTNSGEIIDAFTYYAIRIEPSSKPYSWYLNHVITGAKEINIPPAYLAKILAIESIEDHDRQRDANERAIHSP